MSTRWLTVILAAVVLLLSLSWTARTYLARQRCESFGKIYDSNNGCIEPRQGPPVIIERGLTRT